MCMECDGATPEQVLDHHTELVERYGWMVVAVGGSMWTPGWAYTIGLTERFDHPELAVVMCDEVAAHHRLRQLVTQVEAGVRLEAGSHEVPGAGPLTVRPVAVEQIADGLIAWWPDVADRLGWSMEVPAVLQVDDRDLLCSRHECTDWDLSRAWPLLTRVADGTGGQFRTRRSSSGSARPRPRPGAARGRRASGDPRNRPKRWSP